MKIGITLPQFRHDGRWAVAAAGAADRAGIDGVFVYDHLWPLGRPDRPALAAFPLLGAVAVETQRVQLGTLVARVGLVPDEVLVNSFATLAQMVGDRLIAGLGTGDRASRHENDAYGIAFAPKAVRIAALTRCCRALRALGITTWVGGTSGPVRDVAAAEADALNVWAADPAEVARLVEAGAGGAQVTWGGPVPSDPAAVRDRLAALREAGATWAVCAPAYRSDPVAVVESVAAAASPGE